MKIWAKIGYGSGDLGGNLFFTVVGFWLLKFFTDTVGLDPWYAGLALGIGKFWDAITDPLVAYLSDITETKWGRRKPWMVVGALPLGVSMFLLFGLSSPLEQTPLFLRSALLFMSVSTFYTIVHIPYSALLPELTDHFDERTAISGFRNAFAILGTMAGAVLFDAIIKAFSCAAAGFRAAGLCAGLILTLTAWTAAFSVREPLKNRKNSRQHFLKNNIAVFKNRPFILFLIPWVLNITGVTLVMGGFPFYFEYVLGKKNETGTAMAILLAACFAAVPLMVALAKRLEKKTVYILGMALFSSMTLLIFLGGSGLQAIIRYAALGLAGLGFSAQFVMPPSIIPDAVDYDKTRSGIDREGAYIGMWTFASKLGQAAAGLVSGAILHLSGYLAAGQGQAAEQTSGAKLGIALLVGPLPIVLFAAGALVLSNYPITRTFYAKMKGLSSRTPQR